MLRLLKPASAAMALRLNECTNIVDMSTTVANISQLIHPFIL